MLTRAHGLTLMDIFSVLILLSLSLNDIGCAGGTSSTDEQISGNLILGPGFSIELPWEGNINGSESQGNVTSLGPHSGFQLHWFRDPGLEVDDYLDQLETIYGKNPLQILSRSRTLITVGIGGEGEMLEISYGYSGFTGQKRYAIWMSEISDRVFIAGLGSFASTYPEDGDLFGYILGTFREPHKDTILLPPPKTVRDDLWGRLLADLLASWGYSDARHLPGSSVVTSTSHSVRSWEEESGLFSVDHISTIWPKDIFLRSLAVMKLLEEEGYRTLIAQSRGKVWLVVVSSEGQGLDVSLNPTRPEEMVGVTLIRPTEMAPTSDEAKVQVYESAGEFLKANGLNPVISDSSLKDLSIEGYIQMRCTPSKYVSLQKAEPDQEWLANLDQLLKGATYTQEYSQNVFDCTNTSQILWAILNRSGYEAALMVSYRGHPREDHMWVVVKYTGGGYVTIEATTSEGSSLPYLGRVEEMDEYYYGIMYGSSLHYSMLNPQEGLWLR